LNRIQLPAQYRPNNDQYFYDNVTYYSWGKSLMSMLLTILVVITLIAFSTPSTRFAGLLCVALLVYLQPLLTLAALALLGGAYFYFYR